MTVLALFGYGFIAFGPVAALFLITVARNPHEVITMLLGAFFWLLSLFFSSVIWIVVPPLKNTPAFTLPFSVILQEFFRWVYYRLIRRADKVLEVMSDDRTSRRKQKIAYVGGMGFGAIAGVVAFSNVLRESGGPGIVGIEGSGSQFFILSSAFAANILIILHICWGVLWFDGWEHRNWAEIVVTFLSHMLISCLSLLNTLSTAYFLVSAHIISVILIGYALHTAGAKPGNIKHFFVLR